MGVIDLAKQGKTLEAVQTMLRRRGLPTNIGEANAMLAKQIRDHKHLETILTSCSPEERNMLYETVRPHLKFVPLALDQYVSRAGERAEREQWHVLDEKGQMQEFKPAQDVATAEKAIAKTIQLRTLVLICHKCRAEEQFAQLGAETQVAVRIKALKKGWTLAPQIVCPKCLTSQRANG